ncbi:unnamed protein product [Euphydryas editha]|uniref:Uncharacterized protein n=1 Tax=Euphydryas editha TaxID=104508 RepID=A0AAU9TTX5_EUPED|nr:unnamed protein product [Euphydryas editha]
MDSNDDICDTSKLTFEGNFNQQVQEIMCYIRLTRQEVETLQLLFDDLYQSFNGVWPGCKVLGFGSIVTGLGIKTSDIDCFVQLPSWYYPPDEPFVIKARNILKQKNWIFQQIFAITTARIPIVKFYHVPTKRFCDVNFNSIAGVRNSELINYFLQIDQKILYLAILIKYWAKIQNLTGFNMMSNYCLTLMVIFYLQQRNILPSVMHMQEKVDEYFVGNWNTAFRKANNFCCIEETLYQLLGGFFRYYKTFNYNKFMICPYIGKPIERDLFLKTETVPWEFLLYKINLEYIDKFSSSRQCKPIRLDTFICVQDPFEHNRNCAVSVHVKLAQNIIFHFHKASEIFDRTNENNFLKQLLVTMDKNRPKQKKPKQPAVSNRIKKQNKQTQNLKQNVKFITQSYFKGKKGRNG